MSPRILLGVALSLLTASALGSRRASASTPPSGPDLPPGDAGDAGGNWGSTPEALRPLLQRMEQVLQTPGAGRFFAVVAYAESRFLPTAHNQSPGEVEDSRRAYDNAPASYPELAYRSEARAFGGGGLFGQLAPYFLWSGVRELGAKAPLVASPPTAIFDPRLAAYGAVLNLRALLTRYHVDDLLDARVGWASVQLLGTGRGSPAYFNVRQRFRDNAVKLGVDLDQLPQQLVPGPWMGAKAAFAALTG